MNQNEIPIIIKIYDLYKLFYGYLKLFPKKDKYALGAKCERKFIAVLELILLAKNSKPDERKRIICQASAKFDVLKIFIRLGKDLNLLDQRKYLALQNNLSEIGKILGGWLKSL